eukprot:g49743.t1
MRRRLPPTVQFPVIPQSTTLRVDGNVRQPRWIPPKLAYGVQHCDQLGNENLRIITLMRAADTAPAH